MLRTLLEASCATYGVSVMELNAIVCVKCGAPLQVPHEVRFVTCRHCGVCLEIKQTESVVYATQIAQIDQRTERIEQQLEQMNLRRELELLDSDWTKVGSKLDADPFLMMFCGAMIAIAGLIVAVATLVGQSGWGGVVTALGIAGVGVFMTVSGIGLKRAFLRGENAYVSRRDRIALRLNQLSAALGSIEGEITT